MCHTMISNEIHKWKKTGYGLTTEKRTDAPSYKDAWAHPKRDKDADKPANRPAVVDPQLATKNHLFKYFDHYSINLVEGEG